MLKGWIRSIVSHFAVVIVGDDGGRGRIEWGGVYEYRGFEKEKCKNQSNFGFYVIGFIRNYFFSFFYKRNTNVINFKDL